MSSVRIAGSVVSVERINYSDETVERAPSYSLLAAVDALGGEPRQTAGGAP